LRFTRHAQGILNTDDADVLAIRADQADFLDPDLFVNSMVFGSDESVLLE